MPESRLPTILRLYIATAIGFVLGMLCPLPSSYTSHVDDEPLGPFDIEPLKWKEPTPLRYMPTHPPPPPDFRFDWDKALLNLPVDHCRALPDVASEPRCAYLNATNPIHPRDVLNQWVEAHKKRPIHGIITEIE